MYQAPGQHAHVFQLPDADTTIWRYVDLSKFVSLLQSRALYFCRSDRFEDPFEGSYPIQPFVPIFSSVSPPAENGWVEEQFEQFAGREQQARFRKQLREALLVNCWHINKHESEAVWKLYAQGGSGIAIRSTVERLKASLRCDERVYIGAVSYLDYTNATFPSTDIFHACMSKRKSFEHERELRAVIFDQERFAGPSGTYPIPLDKQKSFGILAAVNLDQLMEEVRVHPAAPSHFQKSVQSLCEKYGLKGEVMASELDAEPRY